MPSHFEYLDSIPKLPDNLISEVYQCIKGTNLYLVPGSNSYLLKQPGADLLKNNFDPDLSDYRVFDTTNNIKNFIRNYWPSLTPRIHCIRNYLPLHKDPDRDIAFNYIIDQGGDNVKTIFFSDNKTLIDALTIDKCRWHILSTNIFHGVINLKTLRIAITVS